MQCEIRGTRKEALPLYRLRPRSPKFRKKGSGNNKTRGTSCVPFHARKKTDLRKKGVNDGPAKGDTFRFRSTRDSLLLSFPGSLHDSPVSVRRIMKIRSHVSRAVARERLSGTLLMCTYVATKIVAHRGSFERQRELEKRTLERESDSDESKDVRRVASALKSHDLRRFTFNLSSLRIIHYLSHLSHKATTNHPSSYTYTLQSYQRYTRVVNLSDTPLRSVLKTRLLVRRHFRIS